MGKPNFLLRTNGVRRKKNVLVGEHLGGLVRNRGLRVMLVATFGGGWAFVVE